MDLTTVETVLIAVAPSVSAILTTIGLLISFFRFIKKTLNKSKEEVEEANKKLVRAYNQIAKIEAKCATMEQVLIELKEKIK